jgi:gas vesicle protein
MRRSIEDTMAMLAGAGIGMGLMYLLDPDSGAKRRGRISHAAREKLDAARNLATGAGDSIGSSIASGAKSIAGSIRDKIHSVHHDLNSAASNAVDDVHAHASTLAESAIDKKRDLVNRASLAIGRDRDHHYLGQSICALGSLALGAGLLWAFDPRLGRSRRAWLRDKTFHWMHQTGDFARRSGRHMGNKMKGRVAVARRTVREWRARPAPLQESQSPIPTAM